MDKYILRPAEAARYLGLGRSTLWGYAKNQPGFPKPIKLGPRCTGWRITDLDKWVQSRESVR